MTLREEKPSATERLDHFKDFVDGNGYHEVGLSVSLPRFHARSFKGLISVLSAQ